MSDQPIERPSMAEARERADDLGREGEDGEIRVAVPKLEDALERFGTPDFLDSLHKHSSGFTLAERLMVIDQLIRTIDEFYVHRDLKWARHAVDAGRALIDRGAEAVLLGGTDLCLAFDGIDPGYEVIDAADLHVAALVPLALV